MTAARDGMAASIGHIKGGAVRALAVTTAARAEALPELPTVAEAGLPGYEAAAWYAVFAPARTPRAVIDKVSAELARAIRLALEFVRATGTVGEKPAGKPIFSENEKAGGLFSKGARMYLLGRLLEERG